MEPSQSQLVTAAIFTALRQTAAIFIALACIALACMPKRWFWNFILTKVLGWSVRGTMPDCDKCVVACYPHTHGLDLFYGLFLIFSTRQVSWI